MHPIVIHGDPWRESPRPHRGRGFYAPVALLVLLLISAGAPLLCTLHCAFWDAVRPSLALTGLAQPHLHVALAEPTPGDFFQIRTLSQAGAAPLLGDSPLTGHTLCPLMAGMDPATNGSDPQPGPVPQPFYALALFALLLPAWAVCTHGWPPLPGRKPTALVLSPPRRPPILFSF